MSSSSSEPLLRDDRAADADDDGLDEAAAGLFLEIHPDDDDAAGRFFEVPLRSDSRDDEARPADDAAATEEDAGALARAAAALASLDGSKPLAAVDEDEEDDDTFRPLPDRPPAAP